MMMTLLLLMFTMMMISEEKKLCDLFSVLCRFYYIASNNCSIVYILYGLLTQAIVIMVIFIIPQAILTKCLICCICNCLTY